MKSVSEAYKASMKRPLRNASHVRIEFGNVDTTAPSDGSWGSNGAAPWSEFDTLDYTFDYSSSAAYATLELNRWIGDGSQDLAPSSGYSKQGYCSSMVSGEDGAFSTVPLLTRPFNLEHTFPGVTLTFDSRCGEWPRAITVKFYKDGNLVDTQVVTGIDKLTVEVPTNALVVDKVSVSFDEMLPYRRARLEQVLYGVKMMFTDTDLISVQQKHDVDPLSRRLPKETFSFTIHDYELRYDPDNPRGIYACIDVRSPVTIQHGYEMDDGTIEWLKEDHYVLNGKPKAKNYQATFTGTGMIGSLSQTYYKGTFGNKSFYDMAEDVLLDAGLTLTEQGTNPWEIDPALKSMYCSNPLPIDTHMNCLQLIAHACRCRLFTDDDNIIHIRPFGVSVVGIYSGDWEDNGEEPYSEWASVNKDTQLGDTYATLELNRWLGDGSQDLAPVNNFTRQGYVSSLVGGSDGSFATTPLVSRKFDVPHDLPIVRIRFDTRCGEWPRSIRVRYYKSGSVVLTKDVTGISSQEISIQTDVTDCDTFDIQFLEMIPYRRPRIERVSYRETDFLLDFTTIKEKSQQTTKTDELQEIDVSLYRHTPDSQATKLFEGSTTETNFHVELRQPATDIAVSVSGGTLVSYTAYAQAVDMILSSGTKTVTITGIKQTETEDVAAYQVNQNGELDKERNQLISNEEMRLALANHFIAYLGFRSTYDAEYRGNPELEVGDLIQTQTNYTSEMDALILVDELTYKGTLSGKLKVKGIL